MRFFLESLLRDIIVVLTQAGSALGHVGLRILEPLTGLLIPQPSSRMQSKLS
jgi:hypothetical protein